MILSSLKLTILYLWRNLRDEHRERLGTSSQKLWTTKPNYKIPICFCFKQVKKPRDRISVLVFCARLQNYRTLWLKVTISTWLYTRMELTNNSIWSWLDTEIRIKATNKRRQSKRKKCRNAAYFNAGSENFGESSTTRSQIIPCSLNLIWLFIYPCMSMSAFIKTD